MRYAAGLYKLARDGQPVEGRQRDDLGPSSVTVKSRIRRHFKSDRSCGLPEGQELDPQWHLRPVRVATGQGQPESFSDGNTQTVAE